MMGTLLTSFLSPQNKQGAGPMLIDGILLRGNVRGKRRFKLNKLDENLTKGRLEFLLKLSNAGPTC